jgi:DNA invertase Pin-like site-specific DNA recombinase
MSTDAQELSPAIQMKAISEYATRAGLRIVETYFDAGRSGLTLARRPAMKKLLKDVVAEPRHFDVVLVYDISRWGRFQDTDASAYYEYHCRLHGIDVKYVQEPFEGADTPLASVIKGLKRAMAAEFSRELAAKTRAGQTAALDRGFHMGTLPCLGISRVAVAKQSGAQRLLGGTEHKAAQTEHVRWVRGPEEEVRLVQRIFRTYATSDISVAHLAAMLKKEGHTAHDGRPISQWMLYSLLECEAFAGHFVWGKARGSRRRSETDPRFRRVADCIEPMIPRDIWEAVQAKRSGRAFRKRTADTLLSDLRAAVARDPTMTAANLQIQGCASRGTYIKHFGSLAAAFELAGAPGKPGREHYVRVRKTRDCGVAMCKAAAQVLCRLGVACERIKFEDRLGHSLVINATVKVRVQVIWARAKYGSMLQWSLPKIYAERFDHVLVVRLRADDSVLDSILFDRTAYFAHPIWFADAAVAGYAVLLTEGQLADKFRSLTPDATRPALQGMLGSMSRSA